MRPQLVDPVAVVNDKLDSLSSLKYAALSLLPSSGEEHLVLNGKRHALCVWRDTLPDKRVRIVVQLFQLGMLGASRPVCAQGFALTPLDEKIPLSEAELSEFS